MQNRELAVAVLAAGAMVGAGLYFGLRSQQQPSAPLPSAQPTPSAPALPPPVPVLGGATPGEVAATRRAVAEAIDKARSGLVKSCWDPSAKTKPEPKKVTLTFVGTIGIEGKPTSWAVSEHREAMRSDIINCVQMGLASIQVPRPAKPVMVDVDFGLP